MPRTLVLSKAVNDSVCCIFSPLSSACYQTPRLFTLLLLMCGHSAVMLHWTLVLDSSSWAVTVNSAWTDQLMLSVATNVTRYHKSCHELSTATYLNLEQINEPWFCGKCRTHNSASAISHSYRMILTRSLARLKSQQHTMKVLVRYHHRLGFILPDTAAL